MFAGKAFANSQCDESERLIICVGGVGAKNATSASQLAHSKGATTLIRWGCAGALDPQLSAGDLVLPNQICNQDGLSIDSSGHLSQQLQGLISTEISVHRGRLTQAPSMITTASQKLNLFKSSTAIAVDMESYSIGKYAQQHQLDFIAVRTIADEAQTNLPQPILAAIDSAGNINNSKVLLNSLLQPWTILPLLRIGLHFNKAQKTLSTLADKLNQLELHPIQSDL